MKTLGEMGVHAKKASGNLARTTSVVKNNAINHLAVLLAAKESGILDANEKDISAGVEAGIAIAYRLRRGSRLVIGYRHRQTVDGYSYDRDRQHPRHSVSVLFRAL